MSRSTRETRVRIRLERDDDGDATIDVDSPDRFLNHMLETFARYAGFGLRIEADGDLHHHRVEDVAITLGQALRDAIPDRCRRYGEATVPMDDALVHAALDAGGRRYYEGPLPSTLYDHFVRSLADNARLTLHLRVLRGRDRHHIVEAAVKAIGLALRRALEPVGGAVFSTKGAVRIRRGERAWDDARDSDPPGDTSTGDVAGRGGHARRSPDLGRAMPCTDEEA